LTIGAPAIAAATGTKNPYILVPAAALGLLAGALAAPQLERYKSFWDRRTKDDLTFRDGCLTDHRGHPPRVHKISDPTLMGVYPARLGTRKSLPEPPLSDIDDSGSTDRKRSDDVGAIDERLPVYIPRDVDHELRHKICSGDFVLLVGGSTAGKTRTAYEAVAAMMPDHVLIAPYNRLAMSVAVSQAERYTRWVLWLDGLEQFLGADGMTRTLLVRLLASPGHHAIVATMRASEHARYTDPVAYSETDQAALELTRDAREVIKQAYCIHMSRIFTEAECARAAERCWDPRIANALAYADRYGLAEYLAAGPELLGIWHDAWEPGNHPRGAAIVAAAIDCRRAGLTRPIPRSLILELHNDYLTSQVGINPRPEPIEEAWEWATRPRRTTASFLMPNLGTNDEAADISSFEVFDYLVDMAKLNRDGAERVTDRALRRCIDYADSTEADRVGNTAHRTGRYSVARDAYSYAFRKRLDAFGPDDPSTLTSRSNLALVLHDLGRLEEARSEHAIVLASRSRVLGTDHPSTLTSRSNLALVLHDLGRLEEAKAEFESVLAARMRILGAEDPNTLTVRHNLARVKHDQGRLAEAEDEFRTVLDARIRVLGRDHPNTLHSHGSLARVLHDQGKLGEAEAEHMLELRTRIRLLDSADAEPARVSLSGVLQDLGRLDEAEAEQSAELTILNTISNSSHYRTLVSREAFPRIIHAMIRLNEAEAEHRKELAAFSRILGPWHPNTLTSRGNHARVLHALGRLDEAEAEHRAVLEVRISILGPDHPNTLVSRNNLALVLEDLGRFDEAATHHRIKLEACMALLGSDHLNTLTSRANLATVLYATGHLDEAAAEHRAVLAARIRILGADHPTTLTSRANLATVLGALGYVDQAVAEHRAVLQARVRTLGPDHPGALSSRANLATVLYAMGRPEEAAAEHRAVLDLQIRLLGAEHPSVKRTRDVLIALDETSRLNDIEQTEVNHIEE
jgi:tetratricopeptide (TPR) repeat protein